MRALFLLSTALMVTIATDAAAHPQTYVNVTGDLLLICDVLGDGGSLNLGGVCYPAGHIVPDANGMSSVCIVDDLFAPTSGFFQQDGGLGFPFCGCANLASGINWDPGSSVMVFIDGPVFGNPLLSLCGTFSMGLIGTVTHT
jgi:hypothetical protein